MHRALLSALSLALIGFTGCNKSSQEKASEKSAEVRQDAEKAMQDIKEDAQNAAAKVQNEAREAVKDIKENAADARQKIANEAGKAGDAVRNAADRDEKAVDRDGRSAGSEVREDGRQTNRDVQNEARQTNRDAQVEARQTNRDLHEALGMDQGRTAADKKLNERIRAAFKQNSVAARAASDISMETVNGNVQLKGSVASEEEKKELASVARKVAGLTHVTDDVKIAERVGRGSND